jgi:hypothetical protein
LADETSAAGWDPVRPYLYWVLRVNRRLPSLPGRLKIAHLLTLPPLVSMWDQPSLIENKVKIHLEPFCVLIGLVFANIVTSRLMDANGIDISALLPDYRSSHRSRAPASQRPSAKALIKSLLNLKQLMP